MITVTNNEEFERMETVKDYIEFILIRLFAIDYFFQFNLKCLKNESSSNRQWHGRI